MNDSNQDNLNSSLRNELNGLIRDLNKINDLQNENAKLLEQINKHLEKVNASEQEFERLFRQVTEKQS